MPDLVQDVRCALRAFRRQAPFFAALLMVLAAGIGAATAMFSLVHALLLRPLPYAQPERLVMLWATRQGEEVLPISLPDFFDWRAQARSFDRLSIAHPWLFAIGPAGHPLRGVPGALVSGEYFDLLGVEPLMGRLLAPEDDRVGAPRVVVIAASTWRDVFHGAPDLIGRTVSVDGEPCRVVGIAPDGFHFSFPHNEPVGVWAPVAAWFPGYADLAAASRDGLGWYAMGRLAGNVSRRAAELELTQIASDARRGSAPDTAAPGLRLVPLQDEMVSAHRADLWLRFLAVGLVATLGCVNVTTLLLSRTSKRRAEFATRIALGATRGRLFWQVVTEITLLFAFAAPLAAIVAWALVDVFFEASIRGPQDPFARAGVRLDGTALAFCLVASLIAGLAVSLGPAFSASRVDPAALHAERGARALPGSRRRRLGAGLVVLQVAVAFALLGASGLALDAVARLLATPVGFEARGLISARLLGRTSQSPNNAELAATNAAMLARIGGAPHVEAVAASDALPYAGWDPTPLPIEAPGGLAAAGDGVAAIRNLVTPGYFETLRTPLLAGRDFSAHDTEGAAPVIIISQALASSLFPDQNPLGKAIRQPLIDPTHRTIVGVVGDRRRMGLSALPVPETYSPAAQAAPPHLVFAVRSNRLADTLADLPRLVASVRPDLGVWLRHIQERLERSIQSSARLAQLMKAFACAALLLALSGVYSLAAASALAKTHEYGIRRALGATPLQIAALSLAPALRAIGVGLVLGLPGALGLGAFLSEQVPGARLFDTSIFAWAALTLGASGLLAGLVANARALGMAPATALRRE